MQATLVLAKLPTELVGGRIPAERLYDAVNVILSYQVSCFYRDQSDYCDYLGLRASFYAMAALDVFTWIHRL